LFDSFETRVELAKVFRQYRPRLVLGLGSRTPMASPDHHQASLITEAAVFYARLSKWDDYFDGLPVHRIDRYLEYYLAFRSLEPPAINPIVVDVGDVIDKKIAAIGAYETQFADRPEVLERIRAFNIQQGLAAGLEAGEVLSNPSPWTTDNLMGLLFGPS
jgi:LmbE family N-acetylglucosaminyl deacetylase